MSELTAEQQDWRVEACEQRAMAESATVRAREAESATRRIARERNALQQRVDRALGICDAIDTVSALAKHREVAMEIRTALVGTLDV
jgi:hypothetical protein